MDATTIEAFEQYVIDRVRDMRVKRGITQRDLADMLEMSKGFISSIESPRQRAKYSLGHIAQLAEIFKCSPRELLPEHWP